MSATFRIEPTLEATLQEPGIRAVTLDLSGLSFIDSTGLGVIAQLFTSMYSPAKVGSFSVHSVFTSAADGWTSTSGS